MKLWKKTTTRTVLDGKRVPSGTPGASKIRTQSPKWYGVLKRADGNRQEIPLTHDETSSRTLLARLQTEQDRLKALGLTDRSKERLKPLPALIEGYHEYLASKGSTARHVSLTIQRIQFIAEALNAKHLSDLSTDGVERLLTKWQRIGSRTTRKGRKAIPLSIESANHYRRSIKAFSRWLWLSEVTDTDQLRRLSIQNSKRDKRRIRRAIDPSDLQKLIKTTATQGDDIIGNGWEMTGTDRSMLYRTAAYTGIRASELASLTPNSLDLDAGTIRIEAKHSKNRRDCVLPLHKSLQEALTPWIQGKSPTERLWPGTWNGWAANMLRRDLKLAEIPYLDSQGRYADFHSLRHTFISSLARSGVHPSEAQRLARHSTITLTMDVYSHVETDRLRTALDKLGGID